MAGVFRAGFTIEGDATEAVNAINRLASSLERIARIFETFARAAENAGQRSARAANQAQQAWANVNPNSRALPSGIPALPAGASAGGAGGASGIGGIGNTINRPPNFGAWTSGLNSIVNSASSAGRSLVDSFGGRAQSMFSAFATKLVNVSYTLGNMLDGLRMVGQGITNAGRSLFFFVSIPLAAFFGSVAKTAIDFDDAMIRVRKTADLTRAELEAMTTEIRRIAREVAMSHVELAGIAEIIGQAGVQSVKSISELTEIFAMLAITTDLTAESATDSMVKIANAFQWNLNASTDEVWRLSNVVNQLENDTAASAAEIVNSMSGWSQVASMMKITAAEAAALSASMISLGISDDEAATALRNMGIYLGRNATKLTEIMGANAKYATLQDTVNAINDDAVQVYLDLATAIEKAGKEGRNVESLLAAMEVGNLRGGRGLAALAQNITMVAENLRKANSQWALSTSLAREYNMAMESTKNQTQVLKNNINDVGITIGNFLLPYLNTFIQAAIPALQMLGDAFGRLREDQKMMAIAMMALAVVAGPVIMIFGQLFHAVMLVALGGLMLVRTFATIMAGGGKLILGMTKIAKFFIGWPGLILAAVVGILKVLTQMGVDVAGFFINLGQSALAWGENLAQQISVGFLAGAVRYVTQAINWVANLIASFFEGHSPPERGPLSGIDKWGSSVLQAYLDGFRKADFSVLEDIGRKIEQILTRGVENDALPAALETVAKSRIDLAQVIEKFNDTGIIDTDLLNQAVSGLGDMADEMAQLVTLNLEYNALQNELDNIEARRKGLNKTYSAEISQIAATNMSLEEKVAAMRDAQRTRDVGLSALGEEEQKIKDQQDLIRDQRDLLNAQVESMMKQDDLWARILDKLDKIGGALGDGIDLTLPEIGTGGFDDISGEIEKTQEQIRSFVEKVEQGKRALEGFFTGFSGGEKMGRLEFMGARDAGISYVPTEEETRAYGLYETLFDIGTKAGELKTQFDGWGESFASIQTDLGTIAGFFEGGLFGGAEGLGIELPKIDFAGMQESFDNSFIGTLISQFNDDMVPAWENFGTKVQWVKDIFDGFGDTVEWILTPLREAWTTLTEGQSVGEILGGIFTTLIDAQAAFASTVLDVFGWIVVGISGLIGGIWGVVTGVWAIIAGFVGFVVGVVKAIGKALSGDGAGALEMLKGAWQSFVAVLAGVFGIIGSIISGVWYAVIGALGAVINWIVNGFKNLVRKVKNFLGISSPSKVFSNIGKNIIDGLLAGLRNTWQSIITFFTEKVPELIQKGREFIAGVGDGAAEKWEDIKSFVSDKVGEWVDSISSKWEEIKASATTLIDKVREGAESKWAEIKSWVSEKIELWRTAIVDKWEKFKNAAKTLINFIKYGVNAAWAQISTYIADKLEEWRTGAETKITEFMDIGRNLMQGLKDGVEEKWNELKSWFQGIADKVKKIFTGEWQIDSPSKVWADMGENLMLGLKVGMDDGLPGALFSAQKSALALTGAMGSTSFPYESFNAVESYGGDSITLRVDTLMVREDADIKKIAAELERLLARKAKNGAQLGRTR